MPILIKGSGGVPVDETVIPLCNVTITHNDADNEDEMMQILGLRTNGDRFGDTLEYGESRTFETNMPFVIMSYIDTRFDCVGAQHTSTQHDISGLYVEMFVPVEENVSVSVG